MSWKSGSLNLLEPSGPHRACYGTALPFNYFVLLPKIQFLVTQYSSNSIEETAVDIAVGCAERLRAGGRGVKLVTGQKETAVNLCVKIN